jgi:hypothetical protein
MFYTFCQNNSSGVFHTDQEMGIAKYVCIECDRPENLQNIAEKIGLYFNGCEDGIDCYCCGDRWCLPYEEGSSEPEVYGEKIVFSNTGSVAVHYLDGSIRWGSRD